MYKVKFDMLSCIFATKEPRDYTVGLGHRREALRQAFTSPVLWKRDANIHRLVVFSTAPSPRFLKCKSAHTQKNPRVVVVCYLFKKTPH